MGDKVDIAAADTLGAPTSEGVHLVESLPEDDERYTLEGELGRGGMGVVRSCYDRRIGRRVASKELRPELARDEDSRHRFLREAQVQGQLEHPAIVPVHDLGVRADGTAYFTMKTLRGVTLRTILAQLVAGDAETAAKYTRNRLLAGFARVCLAVHYAHERGIVHRDLKPANIMFGDFGEVYVLDWGVAKLLTQAEDTAVKQPETPSPTAMTHVGSLLGSPGYMAPEQIEDASAVGVPADVYALGSVLFEILTLTPLHSGVSVRKTLESTQLGADARPSARAPEREPPPEFDAVCEAATANDVRARMPSARALHDAVQSYLDGERDLDLRRERSAEHAKAAVDAARAVRQGGDASLDARREALQQIGRALVLDPGNSLAVSTMAELIAEPPETTPSEVNFAIERVFRRESRWIGKVGAMVYGSVFGFLPLMLMVGVPQPEVVVAFYALLGVCVGLSVMVMRSKVRPLVPILIAMVLSTLALSLTSRFGSPLIVTPTALAVNAAGYAIFLDRRYRWLVTVTTGVCFLGAVALDLSGVLGAPTFSIGGGRIVVTETAMGLQGTPTIVLLVGASLAAITICTLIVGRIRDQLSDAERRIYLYAWHLREFVPPEARQATDPSV